MVRSIVAILMSRGMATESGVLMQSQANADSALGLGMVASARNRAGVSKMKKETTALADHYKGLLQQIVTAGSLVNPETGTPYIPDFQFLGIVEQQFETITSELEAQKIANDALIATQHTEMKGCNTARDTAFTNDGGVIAKQGSMRSARSTHGTCRGEEDTKIETMETDCGDFDELVKKCDDGAGQSHNGQDWYAAFDDSSDGAESTLRNVVNQATMCHAAVDAVTTQAQQCDNDQDAFEQAYCTYSAALVAACTTYDSCYDVSYQDLNTTKDNIQLLEAEQKDIYTMVGKVECFLNVLIQASNHSRQPVQSDITTCQDTAIDTSALDIVYTTDYLGVHDLSVVPKDNCMKTADGKVAHASLESNPSDGYEDHNTNSQFRPGASSWYSKELEQYEGHDKLNDVDDC